ncbi:carbohydrate ABC transporter substrate-binding protein, CUT1 family [Thermanaeromonas toyohensis ToBE]|uniref:Carbohydrate ABC transporter substrate-binding protein, CUT1 family n=1 Tax=Thermanaeromonas toyohensis ToBE TaxID=698762 RepID=A0A1W1W1D8_9FIRM|nr:ABC transporter substrate-binding protein [Thermanaeromonas toyohensis]SMB99418.1 carbohydrate ABC transporter substrate-binding protein, CUT1 family [Thermanaeromonas toyohensis ToBE]
MKGFKALAVLAAVILALAFLGGCGGKGKTQESAKESSENKVVTLNFRTGKDTSGQIKALIKKFEEKYPNIKVNFQEMPWSTDDQHNAYVTALSAQDSSIDVLSLDVIWPAEFASAGWVLPLSKYLPESERAKFLEGPMQAVTYKGEIYAVPWYTDAGLLYYRKDLVKEPPKTWEELKKIAKEQMGKNGIKYGFVFRGNQYEGLVCDALEFIHGNGGEVLEGDKVVINSPQAIEGLKEMVSMVKEKIAPEGVTTYMEEDARNVFQQGEALFMRNWPYAWGKVNEDGSPVKGKVGIAPLPHGPQGKAGAPTLGGWNLAISKFSQHPDEAWKFIEFMTSDEAQKTSALMAGWLPTRKAVYSDTEVLSKNPHFKTLLEAFLTAKPRPVSPYYPQISDAMQINFHKALTGQISAEEAVKNVEKAITEIMKKK